MHQICIGLPDPHQVQNIKWLFENHDSTVEAAKGDYLVQLRNEANGQVSRDAYVGLSESIYNWVGFHSDILETTRVLITAHLSFYKGRFHCVYSLMRIYLPSNG